MGLAGMQFTWQKDVGCRIVGLDINARFQLAMARVGCS